MKFKFLILFFFLLSCKGSGNSTNIKNLFNTSGFAYIYNENDKEKKIISSKIDNTMLVIAHNKLKRGTIVKIINPKNKKTVTLKTTKRIRYPDFYKILISEPLANTLELNSDIPFVEILELKKNKSFVASKAKTFNEEMNVSNKAPVTKVKIHNISTQKIKKNKKSIKFNLILANFYSHESARVLKSNIKKKLPSIKKISIIKKTKNNYQVLSGPYKSINLLKKDYIDLKQYGFEDLDIKIYE